ncbi:MAG: anthranilate phosphoribosyltransferase [archaeon]
MIKEAISAVVEGKDLTEKETIEVFTEIMEGKATDAQIAAFLVALRLKGETIDEITGAVRVMRKKAMKIAPKVDMLVDTCGTGGDSAGTFNISTTAAFVVAGAGIAVAKHGNRSVSSKSGSADVLSMLGVKIDVSPEVVVKCIEEANIGFLFAPQYHGAMKYAIGPRREIGIRTIFNVLGPLTNPAGAKAQVIGVYDAKLTDVLCEVLSNLGTKRAFVVHGYPLDEISICGKTKITELNEGVVTTHTVKPEDFGFRAVGLSLIAGGTPEENSRITLDILNNVKGPRYDITVLNAAAAIAAAGMAGTIKDAIPIAKESIESGRALLALERLKEITNAG